MDCFLWPKRRLTHKYQSDMLIYVKKNLTLFPLFFNLGANIIIHK